MQTNWGEIDIHDAHAHFFSQSFFAGLAHQKGTADVAGLVASLGWDPPVSDEALAKRWVEELDQHGVSRIVLMASLPGDEGSAAAAVRAHPNRIHGYYMLDPLAEGAVQRARKAFEDLHLQGLCLFPAMQGFSVQDERLDPLYAMASEAKGRVVFVHLGVLSVGVYAKLGLPSRFDMSRSNPIDLHCVAQQHPDTTFVVPHFGAGYFRETLMLGATCPNVCVDTSSSNGWTRFLMPRPSLAEVFERTLEVFGADRMLFGSDSSFFPRGWHSAVFASQCEAMQSIGVSSEDAAAILGGNLARLLARDS